MTTYPGEDPAGDHEPRESDDAESTAPIQPGPPAPPSGPVFNPTSAQSGYGQQPYTQNPYTQNPYTQNPYTQNPYTQNPYAPPPQHGFAPAAPNHPQSTTAMVLGIIGVAGFFMCVVPVLLSPFAWALGRNARKEVEASHGRLGGASSARAGEILGIIGTVLLVLVILAVITFVALFAIAGGASSFDTGTSA